VKDPRISQSLMPPPRPSSNATSGSALPSSVIRLIFNSPSFARRHHHARRPLTPEARRPLFNKRGLPLDGVVAEPNLESELGFERHPFRPPASHPRVEAALGGRHRFPGQDC